MALTSTFVALPGTITTGHINDARDILGVLKLSDTLAASLDILASEPEFFESLATVADSVAVQMRERLAGKDAA